MSLKTAIYCVSKNGYNISLNIREKVYKDSDIYVSERVYSTLGLEVQKPEKINKIEGRLVDLVSVTFAA